MKSLVQLFNEITLKERKQVGEVYHFTRLTSLFGILDKNLLKLGSFVPHDSRQGGKQYKGTISTTRDKNFVTTREKSFSMIKISGDQVYLVLDGDKLSDRYQVSPYNDNPQQEKGYGDEQEELWYGKQLEKDRGFKDIRKYVKKVVLTKKFQKELHMTSIKASDVDPDRMSWWEQWREWFYEEELPEELDIEFSNKWDESEASGEERLSDVVNYIASKWNVKVELEK